MTVARILVPVRGDGKGDNVVAHALAVARRHGAHVQAVHCRARPDDMVPYGVVVPQRFRDQIREQAAQLADQEEAALKGKFAQIMTDAGVEIVDSGVPPHDRVSAGWAEEPGKQVDVIRAHGRLADVIAVAKPDRDRNLGVNTLRAALWHTGRPVLLCPPDQAPETLGARIAIAWNGSTEASRAVALALPLIQKAESVVILDGGAPHPASSGEALKHYLALRGVSAVLSAIDGSRDPGGAILSGAKTAGADMIVMGAYSRSREHETVFGGATQTVVDQASMPVLMVH